MESDSTKIVEKEIDSLNDIVLTNKRIYMYSDKNQSLVNIPLDQIKYLSNKYFYFKYLLYLIIAIGIVLMFSNLLFILSLIFDNGRGFELLKLFNPLYAIVAFIVVKVLKFKILTISTGNESIVLRVKKYEIENVNNFLIKILETREEYIKFLNK